MYVGKDDVRQQRPLGEYPSEWVRLDCSRCDRTGKLSRSRLIAEHGAGCGLVNLLNHLSRDCPARKPDPWGNHGCGARYVGLR